MDSLIVFGAKYLIFIVGLLFLVAWVRLPKQGKILLAIGFLTTVIIAAILKEVASYLFFNPRPFVADHVTPLVAHVADNGFPSEHTIAAIAVAALTYYCHRAIGAIAYILAVLVGVSRILAHVHSPLDVLAGLIIGTVAAIGGLAVATKLYKSKPTPSVN